MIDEAAKASSQSTKEDGSKETPTQSTLESLSPSDRRKYDEAIAGKEELEKQIANLTTLQSQSAVKDNTLEVCNELGLNPAAHNDVVRFVRDNVEVSEGQVLTKEGNPDGLPVGKTVKEIVETQMEKSTHWKGVSVGGGVKGNSPVSSGENPWSRESESKAKQYIDKFGEAAADAKAKEAGLHDRHDRHAQQY